MMRWRHSRKGIIEGEVLESQSDHELLAVRLTSMVPGMRKTWYPGEIRLLRRAYIHVMDPVDVGPETPRFRPPDANGEPGEQVMGPDTVEEMEGPEDELPPEAA